MEKPAPPVFNKQNEGHNSEAAIARGLLLGLLKTSWIAVAHFGPSHVGLCLKQTLLLGGPNLCVMSEEIAGEARLERSRRANRATQPFPHLARDFHPL